MKDYLSNDHIVAVLAFNAHKITLQMIKELRLNGYEGKLLFFDNGSNPSFNTMIKDKKLIYHRENENIYVNPAWNKIFDMVDQRYLTLLNNDCFIISPNYFEEIIPHMRQNKLAITSCYTRNVERIKQNTKKKLLAKDCSKKPVRITSRHRRQGWLMTIDMNIYKNLNYKIPDYLKIWFGDDWIWGQIAQGGFKYGIYINRYALHLRSMTISTKSIEMRIQKDIENLSRYGMSWYRNASRVIHRAYISDNMITRIKKIMYKAFSKK